VYVFNTPTQHNTTPRAPAVSSNNTIGQGAIAKSLYLADSTKLERGKEHMLPQPEHMFPQHILPQHKLPQHILPQHIFPQPEHMLTQPRKKSAAFFTNKNILKTILNCFTQGR
jgi:hypothetical protein